MLLKNKKLAKCLIYFLFLLFFNFLQNFLKINIFVFTTTLRTKQQNTQQQKLSLLPQCTDNFVIASEMSMKIQEEKQQQNNLNNNVTVHLQLATVALGDTFCMMITANKSLEDLQNSNEDEIEDGKFNEKSDFSTSEKQFSILHTIEYISLELHHAITGKYKFGIPVLSPRCKCDCVGGETICSVEKYQYRFLYLNQIIVFSGNLVIDITPYKDWTFQAIRLKQPNTVVVLRYKIFERKIPSNGVHWTNTFDEILRIPLNKGTTKFELNAVSQELHNQITGSNSQHKIEINAVGGRPHRQIEPGMYFYQIINDSPPQLREGVPLNGPGENSLEKFGWLRLDEKNGGWIVRKGLEKITQAQHIRVDDCKAQRYRTTFNVEQFVLKNGGNLGEESQIEELINFDLGTLVNDETWVNSIKIGDREAIMEHAEGAALTLTIRTETKPNVVRHISKFSNFTGTIVLDKESNRYLNLTFYNARGTLIGQIFSSADSLSVMESIFSIDIGKFTKEKFQRVVATSVHSPKLVCFYPIGDTDSRICQRLELIYEPIKEKHFADQWQLAQTECIGCNERGVDSFLASLDPRQWLDGLNTPAELFTCTLELVLCLAFLLSSILFFTKCVIPLCRCVHFVAKPSKKK
ncbi:unnamed protein product [Meloidogyne enterolobii]|uniref:Uncharacterized protein n=1 Tax=Meloidogyne enterolobii TaxID=390850 RepID=A0ACB1ANT0_MELEN